MRLLEYFGEASEPCGTCDACDKPPDTGTRPKPRGWRSAASYRRAARRAHFGAGHLIEVLRGKATDKVVQHGHDRLTTFGVGAAVGTGMARGVAALVALGYLAVDRRFRHARLTEAAKPVLKRDRSGGAAPLREAATDAPVVEPKRHTCRPAAGMGTPERARWDALRAWRAETARSRQPAGLRRLPRRDAGGNRAQRRRVDRRHCAISPAWACASSNASATRSSNVVESA